MNSSSSNSSQTSKCPRGDRRDWFCLIHKCKETVSNRTRTSQRSCSRLEPHFRRRQGRWLLRRSTQAWQAYHRRVRLGKGLPGGEITEDGVCCCQFL